MEPEMSKQTMSHVMTMDIATFFEMGFLSAVSGEFQPGHE